MYRVMVVTFGVLGWAWYELSGGSAYEPGTQSVAFLAPPTTFEEAAPARTERVAQVITRSAPVSEIMARPEPEVTRTAGMGTAGLADVSNLSLDLSRVAPGEPDTAGDDETVQLIVTTLRDTAMAPVSEAVTRVASSIDYRRVRGGVVNLRSGPGTTFDVVTQLFEGEEVEVMRDDGTGWVKLRAMAGNNEIGWMSGNFLVASN
ncbi:SH3 domain-containing protein [Primorskyibacter sp. 2E107]|uniref:SH3 domain-containing protein n=1 Tax=Primorskyibacter sp. 2E107 TaxID=3403458 RepID=UPI003AF9E3A5